MAADYRQMEQNFRQFYDFSRKTVVGVGAGGGPFTDLVCESKKLIVIDKTPPPFGSGKQGLPPGGSKIECRLFVRTSVQLRHVAMSCTSSFACTK
jgi:hypothetical protein